MQGTVSRMSRWQLGTRQSRTGRNVRKFTARSESNALRLCYQVKNQKIVQRFRPFRRTRTEPPERAPLGWGLLSRGVRTPAFGDLPCAAAGPRSPRRLVHGPRRERGRRAPCSALGLCRGETHRAHIPGRSHAPTERAPVACGAEGARRLTRVVAADASGRAVALRAHSSGDQCTW